MKPSKLIYLLIFLSFIGLLGSTSCKRNSQEDPGMKPPATYRITLIGKANPSTLYVPYSQPQVSTHITVTALNNDGTPVVGKDVVFQVEKYGYLDGNQISDVRTTNASGVAEINFHIPALMGITMTETIHVYATLIDDGRFDNSFSQIYTNIPIEIIPYFNLGFLITGRVTTPAGIGIGEIMIELKGEGGHASGVAITQTNGEYRFYVNSGWYGTITPISEEYTFSPEEYVIDSMAPISTNMFNMNFIAISSEIINKLTADVLTWDAPNGGGSQLVNVYNLSHEEQIEYVVIPDSNWLRVSPSSGTTPGSFTITADENTSGSTRTGKITISATNTQSAEVTITVVQAVSDITASLSASPSDIYVPASGNVRYTVTVSNPTTSDVLDWTLDSDATWLGITPTSGNTDTNNTFEVTVQGVNPSSTDRVGIIYIRAVFNDIEKIAIVKVRQEGS